LNDGKVQTEEEKIMLAMFYYSFYQHHPEKEGFTSIEEGLNRILANNRFRQEALAILQWNYESLETMELEHDFSFVCPLRMHSKYTTAQVISRTWVLQSNQQPCL
jgi:hypothetical protein